MAQYFREATETCWYEYHSTAMTEALGIIEKFEAVVNTIDYQTSQDIQNIYKTY